MEVFSLSAHHQLLTFINLYNFEEQIYKQKLVDYAVNTKNRGSIIIDILYEIAR